MAEPDERRSILVKPNSKRAIDQAKAALERELGRELTYGDFLANMALSMLVSLGQSITRGAEVTGRDPWRK